MHELEQEIRRFVVENFLFGEDQGKLTGGDSFLELGIIDSTGVLELVAFVEGKFGIAVSDAELIPDNLDSIDNLVGFVQRKTKAAN